MVELRKRKTPHPAPEPKPKKERKTKAKATTNGDAPAADEPAPEPVAESSKAAPAAPVEEEKPAAKEEKPAAKAKSGPPKAGEKIDLDGFGGEIETHEGKKVTLKSLVEESKAGVVLFTYPKASTPGCKFNPLLFLSVNFPKYMQVERDSSLLLTFMLT